jgi:hypothetical protein
MGKSEERMRAMAGGDVARDVGDNWTNAPLALVTLRRSPVGATPL